MNVKEKDLVKLILECSAAMEPGAVSEALRKFLRTRFEPQALTVFEAKSYKVRFEQNKIFRKIGNKFCFLLRIGPGEVIELTGVNDDCLTEFELECLSRAIDSFSEKYKSIVELRGLTYTDDVTGLFNQRYLETVLERELALSKRNNIPFSVLFLDLDHFKEINDTYGHLIGSRILWEVGEELKKTLRESDITFRFGGDEFVCVLSHTGLDAAVNVAERVRIQLEKKRFLAKEGLRIRLTASIGVAAYPEHALTRGEILNAADEALYGVKDGSRNKVIPATTSESKG